MEVLLVSLLNGLVYGMLLFMLASGLTLIFSMMGVLNFAHASVYMLGAYFAYDISRHVGFWPALVLAPVLCGAVGALIEMYGLRRVHQQRPHRGAAVHVRPRLHHRQGGADGLGPAARRLPRARRARPPALHDLRHQFPRLPRLHAADLRADVLRHLADADADAARPRHPGGPHPSGDGRRARPQCPARLHHGVRRRIGARRPRRRDRRNYLVTEPSMAFTMGPIVFVVVVFGGLGSLAGCFIASLIMGFVQTFAVVFDVRSPSPRAASASR